MISKAATKPTIVRTSPQPDPQPSIHPRRPPAERSVSLLHSRGSRPNSRSASSSESGKARQPPSTNSPSSLEALGGKNSSGETSNAENWFDKSNNEVRDSSTTFVDNDPPFFMRNSSTESPPDILNPQLRHLSSLEDRSNSLPLRTELLQLGTEGSSVDDFRSVIDDLTVENNKLKRRLKKYEKLHDSHLKDDKLFEVRIHGLPPEKKRELEATLRKFASSLSPGGVNAFPSDGYSSLLPMLKTSKTASSQASLQNADSAYASMSTSGQGSSAQSGMDGKKSKHTPTQYMAARRQNIHSYLHHIPEGLMPQQNPASMTERAKKKLVVRRMEQLFAGKGAFAGGPQQSMQQQEVSQTAARADRSALEAKGEQAGQEGKREAYIMKQEADESMSSTEKKSEQTSLRKQLEKRKLPPNLSRSQDSDLEQRPTRPLDLDPHRAQVPAENIRYMRQMGFSPQDPGANRSPEEDHGWIYLNFLINMAQLHTINVTSDFVRKSLGEYSNKFEISSDGRKVRWRGGRSVTRNTSSRGDSSNERVSDEGAEGQSPRKRPKLVHPTGGQSAHPGSGMVTSAANRLRPETSRHAYTPLFSHRGDADETDDSSSEEEEEELSESPPYPVPIAGDSSGMASSGIRTSSGAPGASIRKKQKRDDGPIIFYNNARFCTDLSGDRKHNDGKGGPMYTPASSLPVGRPSNLAPIPSEKRGPLAEASRLPEPMDLSDNPIPESMELSFPPDSPTKSASSKGQEPIELEATGIGGVWPADNFSISVNSQHASTPQHVAPNAASHFKTMALPPRIKQILESSGITPKTHPIVDKKFVASAVRGLPPSELPAALSFMPLEDESLEDESDAEDGASEAPPSPGAYLPEAAPQRIDFQYSPSDDDEDDNSDEKEEEEEESDDEVDFLAAARRIDPEGIRQQEREYDANMAERLAEEIPAGSSAATAGGGSGFASPASGVDSHEIRRAKHEARTKAAAATLQRRRTSDSMVAHGAKDSGSSESNDEDGMSDVKS
jgi:hypothetical protein